MRKHIKNAAWSVFAQQGLDGTAIAHIVSESNSSTGSFYNHFRTKEAVFEEILSDLIVEVRSITATARSKADNLDEMLRASYKDLLDYVLGLEGGIAFIARNQHHIRAKLYGFESTSGLLDDIRHDIRRVTSGPSLDTGHVTLVASLIVSNGIEALLLLKGGDDIDTTYLAETMTRLIVQGIGGFLAL